MIIIGVDEVGLGSILGCLVVGAVAWDTAQRLVLADSKTLADSRRRELVPKIKERAEHWVIAQSSAKQIDRFGNARCKRACMRECIRRCVAVVGEVRIIVDGTDPPRSEFEYEMMKKADQKIAAVSAASILAKVYRDDLMVKAAAKYPGYDLENNVGYPTRKHKAALEELGPCPIHRMSTAPLRRLLGLG